MQLDERKVKDLPGTSSVDQAGLELTVSVSILLCRKYFVIKFFNKTDQCSHIQPLSTSIEKFIS